VIAIIKIAIIIALWLAVLVQMRKALKELNR